MQNYGKNFVHNLFTFYSQKIYQKFTIAKIAPPMAAGGATITPPLYNFRG